MLDELVCERVARLLLEGLGLAVEDGVPVLSGEVVDERVPKTLGAVVRDTEGDGDTVLMPIPEAVIVLVGTCVKDILLVTDKEEEALGDFVCVVELVCVIDI